MIATEMEKQHAIENVYTPAVALLRSGLALAHLITLLFTNTAYLIRPVSGRPDPLECSGSSAFSLYCVVPAEHVGVIRWMGIVICLLCISGYLPRLSSLLFAWLCFSAYSSWAITDGGDQLLLNLSIAIAVLNLFEKRGNQWRSPKSVGPLSCGVGLVATWLIKIQAFVIYFQAGVAKAGVNNWANGTEVYYDLRSPMFGASGIRYELLSLLLGNDHFIQALTWGTMAIEVFIAFAIFSSNEFKKVALLLAVMLHLGIAVFMGLISFSVAMVSLISFALTPTGKYIVLSIRKEFSG